TKPISQVSRAASAVLGLVQSPAPQEAAQQLGRALHEVPLKRAGQGHLGRAAARLEQRFRAGVSRFFLGNEASDRLGLPRTAFTYAPLALYPAVSAYESMRRTVPGGTKVATALGEAWLKRRMSHVMRQRQTLYSTDG
ncbi:MAG: hypothetical protein AAFX99_34140, partial [Myxococcota bacterium]